jgi:4-hydroxythreonine-4-phosphate dehydrogenase
MASQRPSIAVTLGDPAGIGPEVVAAAWSDARMTAAADLFAIGPPNILRRAVSLAGSLLQVVEIASPDQRLVGPGKIACLPVGVELGDQVPPPHSAAGGQVAYDSVKLAAELALGGQIDALVTAPLSKAALHAAGHHYPGHTELLAELCGVRDFAMMLYLPAGVANRSPCGMGVVHVTLHTSIASVPALLNVSGVFEKIALAHAALVDLGCVKPRIGVCALNPHAGEGGLFGDEESRIIAPAVASAHEAGYDARGPLPADTLLLEASRGSYDAVVAMYHDQGHIALKLLAMHQAVNITLGLPIVRTSVAHGTAYDRAWSGQAEHSGLVAAVQTAAAVATHRRRQR